jgi:hypothetical protein
MNDVQHIERYLNSALAPEDHLLMEAQLIIDPALRDKVLWQERSHELIRAYSRKQIRSEIEKAHQRLFSESRFSTFRKKIQHIFK